MKVEVIQTLSGNPGGTYLKPGDIAEIPDEEAKRLIAIGVVKPYKATKRPETAMKQSGKAR